jgi:hypothetical protein
MMPGSPTAFDADKRKFSIGRALAIRQGLRGDALRKAS